MTLPAAPPTPWQLRARLRQGRRAHTSRTLAETLTDLYMLVLFLVIYGGAVVASLAHQVHGGAGGGPHAAQTRIWLLAGATVAGAGVVWQGLRTIGPMLATPAGLAWCASTPVDRRGWLLPRFAGLLVTGAGVGALFGGCAAIILNPGGVGPGDPAAGLGAAGLGAAGLLGAALGCAVCASAVLAQVTPPRRRWPAVVGRALSWSGVAGATAVVALDRAGVALPRPASGPRQVTVVIIAAACLLAVATSGYANRCLPRVHRAALSAGAGLAAAATTAVIWLDVSLLSSVLENRRWRRIGRVRSRRWWPGGPASVLLQAEVRRVARHRGALAAYAVLLLVPYAAGLFSPTAATITRIIAGYVAAGRLASGLRTISGSPALRRCIGGADRDLRLLHLVIPGIGLAVWWLLAAAAAPVSTSLIAALLPVGVLGAVYRAATRPPLTYGGALLDTPFGLLPVDLIRQLIRGPDVLGVVIVGQLFLGTRHT